MDFFLSTSKCSFAGGERGRTRKEARYGACVGRGGMREEASSLQVTFSPTYAALVSPYAVTAF